MIMNITNTCVFYIYTCNLINTQLKYCVVIVNEVKLLLENVGLKILFLFLYCFFDIQLSVSIYQTGILARKTFSKKTEQKIPTYQVLALRRCCLVWDME